MIATCVGVVVALGFILTRFFRQLHRIEEERWGKMKDWAFGLQMTREERKRAKAENGNDS